MEKSMSDTRSENTQYEYATFAGGCFWCTETALAHRKGVVSVTSGYTGGHVANPTYEEVSSGETGHTEAVRVEFNPAEISYKTLLGIYWRTIDPTDPGGQFYDRGSQYRTVIYYHTPEQKRMAEESKAKLNASGRFGKPIVTAIEPAEEFFFAEEYHQEFYKKNPLRYQSYAQGSGRSARLAGIWANVD